MATVVSPISDEMNMLLSAVRVVVQIYEQKVHIKSV